MIATKIKLWGALLVGALVLAGLYALNEGAGYTPPSRSHQGIVVRGEASLTEGSFHVKLTTISNKTGTLELVDGNYTKTFAQDVVVLPGERLTMYLTAATDIDREHRRTLECVIKVNGKPMPPPNGQQRLTVRVGDAGEPASCQHTVINPVVPR